MSNINVTPGTGKTVATESIGGVEYQQIKLIDPTAASTTPIGTTSNPINVAKVADSTPATQNVTAQDTGSITTTTNANNQSVRTGSPTTNSTALFTLASIETVIVQVTGTWTGTLLIEGSPDGGTTYYQKAVKQIGTSYIANNFTANFAGTVNTASLTHLSIRATAAWTGTATVTVTKSLNDNGVYVHNGINIQDAVIATNKLTVKSASTAPLATDPAVVVSLSPNSNLGSGQPVINGEQNDFTGTFTNATQTTSVTATNLDGYGNILISINGTYGTASAVFEGSDDSGTTWYGVDAAQTTGNVVESGYTSLTNTNRVWQINVPGFDSVRVRSTAVASGTVNVRMSASAAVGSDGSTVAVTGTVVTDDLAAAPTGAAVPPNAQYQGNIAATALASAATAGNLTGSMGDKFGRTVNVGGTIRDLIGTQTTTISASTTETTIVTAAASVFNDLKAIVVTNTSASTSTRIDFRDTTAGTILFSLISIGGQQPTGFNVGDSRIPQTSVNTNWTAQCATSTTDVRIYAVYEKNR